MSNTQFTMQFHAGNPLAERLRSAQFTCLVEVDTPRADQPFDSAMGIAKTLARCAHRHEVVQGIAITDRLKSENTHDPVRVAQALQNTTPKPLLVHVSGKGSDSHRIRTLLESAYSSGVRTVLAVTGDRSDRHPEGRAHSGRIPPHPVGYTDSVTTIREARNTGHPLFVGCGVNPFKYNPSDQYLQYYKLVRKLSVGADFITVQAGWDMRKHQEVKWFLQMREMEMPILARLMLLNREKIANIHRGLIPGAPVSRSFASQLQRESDINDAQCLAAQLRRLALQVVGCRLLGYSGVQIAGVESEQTLEMVLNAIHTPPDGISTFADWIDAWRDFHADIAFTPASTAFYMFDNLLETESPAYDPESCQLAEQEFPKSSRGDRLRHHLAAHIRPEGFIATIGRHLQKIRNKEAEACRLANNTFSMNLAPKTCPKRLVYGACGGSEADGLCEFGHETCFFHRVLALANDLNKLNRLEDIMPDE
jgi:methylenetetrahydrofolate reductase (NADPH)